VCGLSRGGEAGGGGSVVDSLGGSDGLTVWAVFVASSDIGLMLSPPSSLSPSTPQPPLSRLAASPSLPLPPSPSRW